MAQGITQVEVRLIREQRRHGRVLALVEVQKRILGGHGLGLPWGSRLGHVHAVLGDRNTGVELRRRLQSGVGELYCQRRVLPEGRSFAVDRLSCRQVALVGRLESIGKDVAVRVEHLLVAARLLGNLRGGHDSRVVEFILVDVGNGAIQLWYPHRASIVVEVVIVF